MERTHFAIGLTNHTIIYYSPLNGKDAYNVYTETIVGKNSTGSHIGEITPDCIDGIVNMLAEATAGDSFSRHIPFSNSQMAYLRVDPTNEKAHISIDSFSGDTDINLDITLQEVINLRNTLVKIQKELQP